VGSRDLERGGWTGLRGLEGIRASFFSKRESDALGGGGHKRGGKISIGGSNEKGPKLALCIVREAFGSIRKRLLN